MVVSHYNAPELLAKLQQSFGLLGDKAYQLSTWAAIDQFHLGGEDFCTKAWHAIAVRPQQTVVDIGCGLGGVARYGAQHFDCRVIGLDYSPDFIAAAQWLTQQLLPQKPITYYTADAVDIATLCHQQALSVDHALMLHVGMNLKDKNQLFQQLEKLLPTGGRFVVLDVFTGKNQPINYPVPWADNQAQSFIEPLANYLFYAQSNGFVLTQQQLLTEEAVAYLLAINQHAVAQKPLVTLAWLLGEKTKLKRANLVSNLSNQAVEVGLLVFEKS
jgi:ubiquinone/menaquinone biosynthesis C-methylase UbiE